MTEAQRLPQYVIAGLGQTGLSCVRYLQNQSLAFKVWDTRADLVVSDELAARVNAEITCGEVPQNYWNGVTHLVLSPGIATDLPAVLTAKQAGVSVIGDIELTTASIDPYSPSGNASTEIVAGDFISTGPLRFEGILTRAIKSFFGIIVNITSPL